MVKHMTSLTSNVIFSVTRERVVIGDTLTIERGSIVNGGGGWISEEDMVDDKEALIHLEFQRESLKKLNKTEID
jgi:hypothetical protein